MREEGLVIRGGERLVRPGEEGRVRVEEERDGRVVGASLFVVS